jgi:hypothetical protein
VENEECTEVDSSEKGNADAGAVMGSGSLSVSWDTGSS